MAEKKFDKSAYDYKYRLEHYKEFRCYLTIEEYNNLNELLKKNNLSKSVFLKKAIEDLKKN